jgi:Large polyvalent protein-associated domain 7
MVATTLERNTDLEAIARMNAAAKSHVEPTDLSADAQSTRTFNALELQAIFDEKRRRAELWPIDAAKAEAKRDIEAFRAAPENSRLFLAAGISVQAAVSPAYHAEIRANTPELAQGDFGVNESSSALYASFRATPASPLNKPLELNPNASSEDRLASFAAELEKNKPTSVANAIEAERDQPILTRTEYVVPRAVVNSYNELEGKFYAKDSQRLMFEDKGKSLSTSTDDKKAIADMVVLAKSKNWSEFQLSGSKEFRREAWLQAESQGIKTRGYTPQDADLAVLKTLTAERQKNSITPIIERRKEVETTITTVAPRHDVNKNQAALYAAGEAGKTANMLILKDKPAFQDLKQKELDSVAFWRGIVREQNKDQPSAIQEARLAEFDGKMADPKLRQALPDPALSSIESDVKINAKANEHKTPEHELSL